MKRITEWYTKVVAFLKKQQAQDSYSKQNSPRKGKKNIESPQEEKWGMLKQGKRDSNSGKTQGVRHFWSGQAKNICRKGKKIIDQVTGYRRNRTFFL